MAVAEHIDRYYRISGPENLFKILEQTPAPACVDIQFSAGINPAARWPAGGVNDSMALCIWEACANEGIDPFSFALLTISHDRLGAGFGASNPERRYLRPEMINNSTLRILQEHSTFVGGKVHAFGLFHNSTEVPLCYETLRANLTRLRERGYLPDAHKSFRLDWYIEQHYSFIKQGSRPGEHWQGGIRLTNNRGQYTDRIHLDVNDELAGTKEANELVRLLDREFVRYP